MRLLTYNNNLKTLLSWSVFFSLLLLSYFINWHLIQHNKLSVNLISLTLILDLAVWVPLIYHWVIVRSGLGPRFVTKILVSAGLLSTFYLIPSGSFLAPVAAYYPLVLLSILALIITLGLTRLVPAWLNSKDMQTDQRIAFLAAQTANHSWFSDVLKSEWTALYYAIFGWRLTRTADAITQFSYHQKSGNAGLIIGLSIFQIPGLIFTHIIFLNISPIFATVLTIGHIYTLYFGLAQAMALKNRFVQIESQQLILRCGLMFDVSIPIDNIQSVQKITPMAAEEQIEGQIKATFFGFANIRITLKESIKMPIFAGLSKDCREIVIGLDEPHQFANLLTNKILETPKSE